MTRKSICLRCNGKGSIDAFRHYANGVCFACDGSGEFEGTVLRQGEKGFFEVIGSKAIWQFRTLKDNWGYAFPKGEKPEDIILQAVQGFGRSGKTLFRIRLVGEEQVAVARRIYTAAMADIDPGDIDDEWLGFKPSRCQVTRNGRGVSHL